MIPPTIRATRRRAAALTSGAADQPDQLRDAIAALALPDSAARVLPYAPAATALVAGTAFALFGGGGVAAVVVASAAALAALHRSTPRRRAATTERALPVVLDAVARHLRTGGSLAQAIAAAHPPPTAPDLQRSWARLVDLIPLVGVAGALDDWAASSEDAGQGTRPDRASSAVALDRGSRRSMHLAAAALSLAATTGGSPARAIDGVAATLRSRLAVAEEIRALSSQARASAIVIALAPVGFGILAASSDDRTRDFLASPTGLVLLTAGLALDASGAWWMAHLCRPPVGAT